MLSRPIVAELSKAESQRISPHKSANSRPRKLRRWIALGAAVAAFALLYLLDARMKSSDLAGFAPKDSTLVVSSADAPRVWRNLESSDTYARVMEAAPQLLPGLVLEGRKASGIRWTPARWSTWFGERLVVARYQEQTGVCVRPGVLLRVAHFFLGLSGAGDGGEGLYRVGGAVLAWRDGFLIASASPAYVRAALSETSQRINLPGDSSSVFFDWRGEPACLLTLRAGETLSVQGWVDFDLAARDAPLTMVGTWPEEPLLEVAGSSAEELIDLVAALVPEYPGSELVRQAFEELDDELPARWAEGTNEFSLALISVDTSEFLAVPEIAIALRGESLLPLLRPPPDSIRYEWSGVTGWFQPWLGEKMSVCAASTPDLRFFTSQEPAMARYIGRLQEGRATESDLVVSFDLQHFSSIAKTLVRRAAEHQLLPRQNLDDVEEGAVPMLDAIAQLGRLRLEARAGGGGMLVRGGLEAIDDPSSTGGADS